MLVCNVSVRARRTIAAEIIEVAGAAEDVPGVAGFALLVDEPVAASDTLDGILGQILAEAASAADASDAGLAYTVLMDEPASAADLVSTTGIVLVPRRAMLPDVFVNSDGTVRQANANGVMVNL